MIRGIALAGTVMVLAVTPAAAQGYLAGKAEKLTKLELGLGESGFDKKGGDYEIVTGKGYSLAISSTGVHECAFVAPSFFENIYLRKVEVNKVEIKVAALREIEMEQEGEAEIYFVAIKPGEYEWKCKGLDSKGMAGKFIVK